MVSRSLSVITALALLVLAVQSGRTVWGYLTGPLDLVRVEGDLSGAERTIVVAAVNEAMSMGDAINPSDLQEKIADIDWIRAVTVRRNWPNSVHVTVNRELPTVAVGN